MVCFCDRRTVGTPENSVWEPKTIGYDKTLTGDAFFEAAASVIKSMAKLPGQVMNIGLNLACFELA
jgi:hypothetical protein